jgi:hypothetical protein
VTALWEIQWVKRASAFRPNLRYYYLGFYIHSCPKMKYKGDYEPSDLLCPETYEWVPLASCRALLDATPYARLAQVRFPFPSIHGLRSMTLPLWVIRHIANRRTP